MKYFIFFIIVFISLSCTSEECNYDIDCNDGLICLNNKCESPKNECETDTDCIENNRCGEGVPCKCEQNVEVKICKTYNPCRENPCKTEHQTICKVTTDSTNNFYECLCDEKYKDENGVCRFDCSDKENTHTNSNNEGCSCDTNYYPDDNNICKFNCNNFPFKETNETNNGCTCIENYEEISGECKFICTDNNSHINDTNDGCVCNNFYLEDENELCKFDCTDDSFSKTNETNDDCVCITENYKLKNGLCTYICPENGIENSENNGCVCKTGYHFEGELCESNTQITICNELNIEHATSTIVDVERVWTEDNGWSVIPDCDWDCLTGYNKLEDSCIYNCGDYGEVNTENNGCICNENYLYSEDEEECRFNCGSDENMTVNDTNNGCICLNNFALNESNECYCEDFYTTRDNNDTITNASLLPLEENENIFNLRLTKLDAGDCVLKDHSYFKINLQASKKLKFLIEFTHSISDMDMKLFKDGIIKKTSAGVSNTETFTYQAGNSDEELILDIYSFNHKISNYQLTITKLCTSNTDCNNGLVCLNESCIQNSCENVVCGVNEECRVLSATQYMCNCEDNYFRENNICTSPCDVGSCGDHGDCNATSTTEYSCSCEDNYFEDDSKICVTPCDVGSCGDHGECNATSTTEYSCNCEDNYFEDDSKICVSPCSILNCNENEECYPINANYAECRCSDGFYLNESGICINSCNNIDCGENKSCTSLNNTEYICNCNEGFYKDGDICTERPSCEDRYTSESLNNSSSTVKTLQLTDRVTILNGLSTKKMDNGECSEADDWYRFLVPQNSKLKIDLSFIHANGDIDMNLYNSSNLTSSVGHSGGVSNSEHISYSVVNEGLYYLKVYLEGNNYDMRIEIIPSCDTITDCNDENYCLNNECTYCSDLCETNQSSTGICNVVEANYQCECSEGYYETITHKCVNPCDTISCFENASCISSSYNQYSCVCDNGYTYSNTLYKCVLAN